MRLRSQEPVTLRGDVILNDRMLLAPVRIHKTKYEFKAEQYVPLKR